MRTIGLITTPKTVSDVKEDKEKKNGKVQK